ncbi:MAG TPA: hypothetical protein VMU25_01590 [Candidatus Paceibacterota bacterium]|nr:hypothetical protein [Candidatus Paceibacterota bacterium]
MQHGAFWWRHDSVTKTLLEAFALTLALFVSGAGALQAYAGNVTLSVNVQTSLSFSTTNQGFANGATSLTPGSPLMATTTLSVTTNDANGWNVTLSGDNKTNVNNNLETAGNISSIPDQTEWIPAAATSSAGNAVRIGSFTNSGNVLAFRVATATSTNGTVFYAPSWWGTQDNYATDNANTLFAGISSSTVQRQIGNAGAGSYSASAHLNEVQYYLKVSTTQPTGSYTAPITYTATGN